MSSFNRAEVGLLIVGLQMIGMTTCLIANDLHWGKSAATQRTLVCLICSMAGAPWAAPWALKALASTPRAPSPESYKA